MCGQRCGLHCSYSTVAVYDCAVAVLDLIAVVRLQSPNSIRLQLRVYTLGLQ